MLRPTRSRHRAGNEFRQLSKLLALALFGIADLERIEMIGHRLHTNTSHLRQPALSPLVVLDVAERFAPALGNAKIELLDVVVFAQPLWLAVEYHAAIFQDIAVAGV